MLNRWHSVGRAQAAGIHLACSVVLAAATAWLVFGVWYPWPFNLLSGGTELFKLLVSVDVVLGPLLTLVIFNRAKPRAELRRDLSVIVLLQLAAMGYGLYAMAVARPAVIALEVDRFRVVSALSVVETELASAPAGMGELSWTGPRLLHTRQPSSAEKVDAVLMAQAGADLGMRPSFWLPWDAKARDSAKQHALPASELANRGGREAALLFDVAARAHLRVDQMGYVPILARRSDWVALLNASTGDLVGYAPVNGF
ncbi:TfpX/TfpZ family type IV pilin accessory protein [Paucibacter soli]|uniref:TfpX/TfpZ family type IV pilin accessory protein n=1 Tax=Paucibacter soli TaxID=3133433 RepID=UPI0030A3BA5B